MAHSEPPISRAAVGLWASVVPNGWDWSQAVAVDARYLAALERLEAAAQEVWEQSYVAGADGWDGVEAVPMGWENALHSLGALLAALPPPGPPDGD